MSLLISSLPTALLSECQLRGECHVNWQKVLLMACLTLEKAYDGRGILALFVMLDWVVYGTGFITESWSLACDGTV